MKINQQVLVFDAASLSPESKFWGGVLGGVVKVYDRWHMVFVEDKPVLGIQLAPDHVPPDWPDGAPQQIHLDLWVDDVEAAHEEVMSLGAKLLQPAAPPPPDAADNHQVYADPAGHPFCLCWVIKTSQVDELVTI
jgi:predicted enzyme related to lactoylglutathione lyase